MKNIIFPDEVRAKSRQDMADLYRKLRKANPAYARLLYKREREALARLKAWLFG